MQHDHGLTVTLRPRSTGFHLLVVAGDLDHHTAPRLRTALEEVPSASGDALVIDLSALTFCDSTGVATLVAAHQRAQGTGVTLALAGLDPDIVRLFRIMGLDQVFSLYDTVEEATAAVTS